MSEKLCVGKALDMLLGYETDVYGAIKASEIPALAKRYGLVTSVKGLIPDDGEDEWYEYEIRLDEPHILLIETDREARKGHAHYVPNLRGHVHAISTGMMVVVGVIHKPYGKEEE